MDTQKLFDFFSSIHPVTETFKSACEKELTPLSLPRDYILLEAPKISEHSYFLDTGFAMSYTFIKGKKQIESFWPEGQMIISPKSFFEQVPSHEFIQLMQQSDVLCISYAGVLRLFKHFPEAQYIYRVIMNQRYETCRERGRDMQDLIARDRYKKVRMTFPHIEQIIPQEYIASYLGITPQSLSRIKRNKRRT